MEFLKYFSVVFLLVCSGCINQIKAKHYLSSGKGMEVVSTNGLHNGILLKTKTDKWTTLTFNGIKCKMEVPQGVVEDNDRLCLLSDFPKSSSLLMHPLDFGYYDYRFILQVKLKRVTRKYFDEDIELSKEVLAQKSDKEYRRFFEWRYIKEHPVLDSYETDQVVFYRQHIPYPNGDILLVHGSIVKITDKNTKLPLHKDMDKTMRRIINSIEIIE